MSTTEKSRDLKDTQDYQSDANRAKSTTSPALNDEEIDHTPESDFRHNTQKPGSDQSARRV